MPCWVVPVVAAELWGVGVDHVLRAVADGHVPSKQEYGFTVVDVAPDGAHCPPPRGPDQPAPPTFVLLEDLTPTPPPAEIPFVPQAIDHDDSSELPPLDEEEDDVPIAHWREVRSRVGRTRQPPKRLAPRAA
jgi:hypothetical protein